MEDARGDFEAGFEFLVDDEVRAESDERFALEDVARAGDDEELRGEVTGSGDGATECVGVVDEKDEDASMLEAPHRT